MADVPQLTSKGRQKMRGGRPVVVRIYRDELGRAECRKASTGTITLHHPREMP